MFFVKILPAVGTYFIEEEKFLQMCTYLVLASPKSVKLTYVYDDFVWIFRTVPPLATPLIRLYFLMLIVNHVEKNLTYYF